MINLKDKDGQFQKMLICGIPGSGKTFFSKKLVNQNNYNVLVWTPNKHDFEDVGNNFIVYHNQKLDAKIARGEVVTRAEIQEDFEQFLIAGKSLAQQKLIDGLLIDELDLYYSSNHGNSPTMEFLITNHRHIPEGRGMFLIGITRKPQDIGTKFSGTCMHQIFFTMDEVNAITRLNKIYTNLGNDVKAVPFKSYKFYHKEIGKEPILCNPY